MKKYSELSKSWKDEIQRAMTDPEGLHLAPGSICGAFYDSRVRSWLINSQWIKKSGGFYIITQRGYNES